MEEVPHHTAVGIRYKVDLFYKVCIVNDETPSEDC